MRARRQYPLRDGRRQIPLNNCMQVKDLLQLEKDLEEWKATASLCKGSKPDHAIGASALSSCKAQGYRARQTGKSQLNKSTGKREKLGGKKRKAGKGPNQVSPTRTG